MKARPLTSTRLASKSHFGSNSSQHFGQTAGSQTIKLNQGAGRQVFNNKTLEASSSSQHPSMVQMKGTFSRIGSQTNAATAAQQEQ